MNKIIALNGAKNSKKDYVANKLHQLIENAEYVKPYTDKPKLSSAELPVGYHQVPSEDMDIMLETEDVLCVVKIGNYRWAFFKNQLEKDYNIMILDDYMLCKVIDNYDDVVSVRIKSEHESESDRFGAYLYDHEFDMVFDSDNDSLEKFKEVI